MLFRSHLSHVFVDDLCEAFVRSIDRGERLTDASVSGPRRDEGVYFTAFAEPIELGEFARLAGALQGRPKVRVVHMPMPLTILGTALQEVRARLQGWQMLINFDKLREARGRFWTCVSDKALRHGLFEAPRTFDERVAETIDWYRANGWLQLKLWQRPP